MEQRNERVVSVLSVHTAPIWSLPWQTCEPLKQELARIYERLNVERVHIQLAPGFGWWAADQAKHLGIPFVAWEPFPTWAEVSMAPGVLEYAGQQKRRQHAERVEFVSGVPDLAAFGKLRRTLNRLAGTTVAVGPVPEWFAREVWAADTDLLVIDPATLVAARRKRVAS